MVLPDSIGISRVPTYSGTAPRQRPKLRLRDSHPLRWRFPTRFGSLKSAIRRTCRPLRNSPTTPQGQRLQPVTPPRFGLLPFRSPLLRESHVVSSSSGYLDVSVPLVRLDAAYVFSRIDDRASPRPGSPIRTPGDQRSLAAPPGFSQLATSFFAVLCLGIHLAPLLLDPLTLPRSWHTSTRPLGTPFLLHDPTPTCQKAALQPA